MLKKLILFLLSLWMILTGCEEKLDYKIDHFETANLVVDGCISTDTTSHKVMLSWSADFFTQEPQNMETGAIVTISDNQGNMFPLHETTEPGIYATESGVYGIVGNTYTLHIELEDGRTYYASDKINRVPQIDSLKQSNNYNHFDPSTDHFGYGYDILYYGPEPAGMGDYYLWNVYVNDTLLNDTILEAVFTDDEFVDGNYIKEFELAFINENELHTDTAEVTIETNSISKEYFLFLIGVMLETVWRGSPWDGPPANPESNIKPEGRGFFHACARSKKSICIVKTPRGAKKVL